MRNKHNGIRRTRSTQTRVPELGYYLIITEAKETEKNYFNGLKDSLPEDIKSKITIKTIVSDTKSLKYKTERIQAEEAGYKQVWVIFDRDQNDSFDSLIKDVESLGASAGWSNPCFEIWMHAYFGKMPNSQTSKKCCEDFSKTFKNKTKKEYEKNDAHIYKNLVSFGNESEAISLAESKLKEARRKTNAPSEMRPATTVYQLVKEIRGKCQ